MINSIKPVYIQLYLLLTSVLISAASKTNLTCYSCFTADQSNYCVMNVTTSNTITCSIKDTFCRVYLQQSAGHFVSLERGCASTCRPGCGTWGADIDNDKCYQCCHNDLCNTGNVGVTSHSVSLLNTIIIAAVLCVPYFCIRP